MLWYHRLLPTRFCLILLRWLSYCPPSSKVNVHCCLYFQTQAPEISITPQCLPDIYTYMLGVEYLNWDDCIRTGFHRAATMLVNRLGRSRSDVFLLECAG